VERNIDPAGGICTSKAVMQKPQKQPTRADR
jgi:hypothetical protein